MASKPTKKRRSRQDHLQFCQTMEARAWEHGFDLICRPRLPRYAHELFCGHTVLLGVQTIERHPWGDAWCEFCGRYSMSLSAKEIAW